MRRFMLLLALAVQAMSLSSCRGSSEDECSTDDHADVSGMWNLTTTVTSSCDQDDVGDVDTEIIDVVQDGDRVSFEMSGFILVGTISGTICGDTFSAAAFESADILGCAGTETVSVQGSVDGDSAEGTTSWSQAIADPEACFGFTSCSGTTSFTAERMP
jgi:hypothetical protein